MDRIWVVEMNCEDDDRGFSPTVGVGIEREQGRLRLHEWKERNPDDKFRLRKYVREEKR